MKILPNIKYDGMRFTCNNMSTILTLIYRDSKYYVTKDKDMKSAAVTNIEHVRNSLNDGFWKRINESKR